MAQISQLADGTYTKTYSDTEIAIIKQLHEERLLRQQGDAELAAQFITLDNRVKVIEDERFSLAELQGQINANSLRVDAAELRITQLEQAVVVDAYSKTQVDAMMVPWRVEEIQRTFETPANYMFDEANLQEIKVGIAHYKDANINEPYGFQVLPNTMRRYSIAAYCSTPRKVEFTISYADRCVVYVNDSIVATYQEDGGNFDKTKKVLEVDLVTGWNTIQFLIANENQEGGLVVESNLVAAVDRLSSLGTLVGRITGDQIQSGTLDERHFSQNMDITIKKIHATTTSEPSGVFGDPDRYGAIQIADGVIEKFKDEPFIMHGDVKIMGYIRDKDGKIIDGGGGGGLSTADREKLDSIEWGAEVNQNAFSYVKLVDLPTTPTEPFKNVINAIFKMDTLRIRGDLGITFDIETIQENGEDRQQMVIKNSPTVFKEYLFISEQDQDTFQIDPAVGKFQLGRGIVEVYIDGIRQSYANFYEVDEYTVRLNEKLPKGLKVLVRWQEGSPQFAKETIVSVANIPVATRTEDGLMSRFHVNDLYDHKHEMEDITDLRVYNGIQIDDGTDIIKIEAGEGSQDIKFRAGTNIKMEVLNDTIRISSNGPTVKAGSGIQVVGSPETGYEIINDRRIEGTRGIEVEHRDGVEIIKGPNFVEGNGIDVQILDDTTYRITNNMSLTSVGGIDVVGNAEDGYVLKNTVKIIESGGIEVMGDAVSGYKLRNAMSLQASANGCVIVTGSAATGYTITGLWPSITSGEGIAVDTFGDGTYLVKNTGVTSYNGQTGEVTGVGSLNKVAEGRGTRVVHHGNGDYVVHNTGVVELVDDGIGGGIDVQDLGNQIWKIKNTGIIKNLAGSGISVSTNLQGESTITNTGVLQVSAGPGISVSGSTGYVTISNDGIVALVEGEGIDINTNAQGVATIRNAGVVEVIPGRGIDVSQTGTSVTIINDGIVDLVEGEGIDINTNGSGMATIRNDGVLSINGQTGHVTIDMDPPEPTFMTVAMTPFFNTGDWDGSWVRQSGSKGDFFYTWGAKIAGLTHYNVVVKCGVGSPGDSFDVYLYSGDDTNVLDSATVTTVRNGADGEIVFFSVDVSHLPDDCITGIHVGGMNISGDAHIQFMRAWLSNGPGSPGDYQV